jgi:hypothetical protein
MRPRRDTNQDFPIAQAIDILRLSRDGNELSAPELKTVEMAVNGRLNHTGKLVLAYLVTRLRTCRDRRTSS